MFKKFNLCLILFVLFFVFVNMASASIPKDTLVIGMNTEAFITCDPAQTNDPPLNAIIYHTYSKLIHVGYKDNKFTIEPELAESWEVASDNKTWTFHLRKDLTFANGDPLKADAVVYSYRRVLKLNKGIAYLFSNNLDLTEEDFTAPDDYTVQIVTSASPSNIVLNILGSSIVASVLNPKVVKEHEVDGDMGMAWLNEHSAGSGPYVLKEWDRNIKLVLVANENYWGEAPPIKNIIVQNIPESTDQLLLLKKGDIDVAFDLTTEQLIPLEKSPDVHVVSNPQQGNQFLGMNMGWGPFQDVRVRQAVKYAIDYDAVMEVTYSGFAIRCQQFNIKGYFGYIEDNPYDYDVEKAKQLMAEAGYADGFDVEFVTSTEEYRKHAAVVLQENLAKIGIRTNIVTMQASQMYALFRQQGVNLIFAGWGGDYADPSGFANPYCNYRAKQIAWRLKWYDDYAADLVDAGNTEMNEDKRWQMYRDLTNYFQIYSPFAVIFQPLTLWGVRDEVKGWSDTVGGYSIHYDFTKTSK